MTAVALSAPQGLAVDAARDAALAGGTAVDAALAAAAVLCVVYPHQCSLGGDLTALVRRPDGRVTAILSIGAAAAETDVAAIRARDQGMPRQGPLTVTVPGVVAGWSALAAGEARLGLGEPLRRAAGLAEAGVPVSAGLRRAICDREAAVAADPGLRAVLLRDGRPVERLRQPALAAMLAGLAEDPEAFYRGALAERLVDGLRDLGSPLTVADLRAHRAESVAPIVLETAGGRWWAAPPPAQGATALALITPDPDHGTVARAQAAHSARARLLGDPRGGAIDITGMRDPPRAGSQPAVALRTNGDTVAICAVDDEGRSVSLIQSVFQTFGAGLLEPRTGIVLHNRGSAFALLDDAAEHARHPGGLRPGHRPPHTLCPLLGEADGVRVAIGCQGGRAQPLVLSQVAAEALTVDGDLEQLLARPRWVVGDRDLGFDLETVLAEPGADPGQLPEELALVRTRGPDDRCGHVSVARAAGEVLSCAADPRADGRGVVAATTSREKSTDDPWRSR